MEEMVLFKWILFGRIIVNLLGAWSPRYLLGKSLKEERHLLHKQEQIHNSPLLAPNYSLSKVQEYASGTKGKALFCSHSSSSNGMSTEEVTQEQMFQEML